VFNALKLWETFVLCPGAVICCEVSKVTAKVTATSKAKKKNKKKKKNKNLEVDKTKKSTEIEHKTAKRSIWDLTDAERWGDLFLSDEQVDMLFDDFWKVVEAQEA